MLYMLSLTLTVILAMICGFIARPIQGGQFLSGVKNYRVYAAVLYLVPLIFLIPYVLNILNTGTWYTLSLESIPLPLWAINILGGIVICGLMLRAHYGPNHGHQMDMGNVEGTLGGDFKGMVIRFGLPLLIAMVIVVGFTPPEGSLFKVLALGSWIFAAFIPALTYRLCWFIGDVVIVDTPVLKWFKAYFPEWLGPTEVAERTYAGFYQGAIALGFVFLLLN